MVKLKIGQIINFKPNYKHIYSYFIILNNLIKFRRIGYSHSAIIKEVDIQKGICVVSEAVNRGFVSVDYGYCNMLNKVFAGDVVLGRTKHNLFNVKETIEKYEGIKYGWFDIISIGIFTILNLLTRLITFNKYKNVLKSLYSMMPDTKKGICSEIVAKVLYDSSNKQVDLSKEYDKIYSQIEPMDILNSNQIIWYKPV